MVVEAARAGGTRQSLLEVATELFNRHSYAGTSLQMIADEVGITKASIYHHFRTREDLLLAAVEPMEVELRKAVDAAEAGRTPHARAERMITGYATVAVRHRALLSVLAGDIAVIRFLRERPESRDLVDRQFRLLAEVDPGPGGQIKAAAVFAGLAGAVRPGEPFPVLTGRPGSGVTDLDDDTLRQHLIDVGRRILGLRRRSPINRSPIN